MRSKWLDWTPGSVGFVGPVLEENPIIRVEDPRIIESPPVQEPAKPTKPPASKRACDLQPSRLVLESTQRELPYEGNEINEERVNPYQRFLRSTLATVSDQPVGMVPWLKQNRPMLCEKLAVQLPDEIHRLWEGQAPLDEFQRVIDIWLEAYRTGCEMYQQGREAVMMPTHLPDPQRDNYGNWSVEGYWTVGRTIMWNGVEPQTFCGRPSRFVALTKDGEESTCPFAGGEATWPNPAVPDPTQLSPTFRKPTMGMTWQAGHEAQH